MNCQITLKENTNGITSVAGAILLAAISIALAALVLAHGLDLSNVQPSPELYFTYVEVKTNGLIYATAVGSSKISAGDLKFFLDDQAVLPDAANFAIDGQPYIQGVNDKLTGGSKIALKTANSYEIGQKVNILIIHIPTGSLLCEATVEVRGE
jgi:FlaG/FlaF family flagellin (archaellin)